MGNQCKSARMGVTEACFLVAVRKYFNYLKITDITLNERFMIWETPERQAEVRWIILIHRIKNYMNNKQTNPQTIMIITGQE